MRKPLEVLLTGLVLAGCVKLPDPVPFGEDVRSRQAISFSATGVSVDEQGRRLAWDPSRGLISLSGAEEVVLPLANVAMNDVIEDVTIIPGGRLGIIARNEGRVLNMDGSFVSRFCYLPDSLQGPQQPNEPVLSQLSRAITFNAELGRLYVQPITFRGSDLIDSQLGQFEIGNDEPLNWQPMNALEGMAGGMVARAPNSLLMGFGTRIYDYDPTQQLFRNTYELGATVTAIEGMSVDPVTQTLLVLDAPRRQVLELPMPPK